ncbi:MAG: hypothetical protein SVW02_02220 [Candidatus Nanohaloarchaea archaeon]|nr:hypothetical protein [Candidatus Nanohaloarchaea archaeon]
MRLRDRLGIGAHRQRQLSRAMQVVLLGFAAAGVVEGRPAVIVNAVLGLAITFLPALLERDRGIVMDTGLVLWLTAAVFLHVVGGAGPYRSISWWDHLTHAFSASVVAAAGYTGFRAIEQHSPAVQFPRNLLFVFILIFVMAFGVIWELMEFGLGIAADLAGTAPFLTQYGLDDTMMDLVFDLIGGVTVALFGEAYILGLTDQVVAYLHRARPH